MGASDNDGERRALQGRIDRPDQLVRGLAREVLFCQDDMGPLLFVERRAYLAGLQEAIDGLDRARVALVRARQQLEDAAPPCQGTDGRRRASPPAARPLPAAPPGPGGPRCVLTACCGMVTSSPARPTRPSPGLTAGPLTVAASRDLVD
jgi:hypothetical protein